MLRGVRALESLKETEGWLYLTGRFGGYDELAMQVIAKRLMRGEDVDRDEVVFSRGYAAALIDVFETPERLNEELERAAEKAYKRAQQRADEATGEHSPYA